MTPADIQQLTEAWRHKAQTLREKYKAPDARAESASSAATAIETCAEDLEQWAREPVES